MKTYDVIVTRDITESVTIRVLADRPEEAAELAIEKAEREALQWEINDGYSDPYLGGADYDDVTEVNEPTCEDCGSLPTANICSACERFQQKEVKKWQ